MEAFNKGQRKASKSLVRYAMRGAYWVGKLETSEALPLGHVFVALKLHTTPKSCSRAPIMCET